MAHFAVVCLLKCLLLCVISHHNSYAQWVYPDDGCRTPEGGTGDCIAVKQCKPMRDFLAAAPKPLTQKTIKKLNDYTCDYEGKVVKVCCPPGPIPSDNENIQTTTGPPPPPPDVSNHRNFKLLPTDCGYIDLGDRIRNGVNASLSEFPWMALLSYNTKRGPQFKCGGSIINDKWILTAAHCISNLKEPLLGVRVGEHNIVTRVDCEIQESGKNKCAGPVQDLAIEETHIHPSYNSTIISNDIGLLRVTKMNLNVPHVKPVCLPVNEAREAEFKNVIVTGWGVTDSGQSSTILQKVNLPMVNTDECRKIYLADPKVSINHKQLCAGGKDNKDSCPGDSGGPLQVASYLNEETRYVQFGIVSFGPRFCGLQGFPGVYTNIAYYMDWILDTIRP